MTLLVFIFIFSPSRNIILESYTTEKPPQFISTRDSTRDLFEISSRLSSQKRDVSSTHGEFILKAGKTFWFETKGSTYLKYSLDENSLLEALPGKFFGAIPLYNDSNGVLFGESKLFKPLFGFPKIYFSQALLEIEKRPLKNPSQIQVLASFQKKVESADQEQIKKEREIMKNAILPKAENSLGNICFESESPLNSKIVSFFGSYRELPSGQQYFHTGLDMRAWTGTRISAMADGKVVLAQKFIMPGNSVFIDHGYGIYSKYFHLSQILVEEGQAVKKGDVIALSGGTGRVEAPHFHWEVVVQGIVTDPPSFVENQKSLCGFSEPQATTELTHFDLQKTVTKSPIDF